MGVGSVGGRFMDAVYRRGALACRRARGRLTVKRKIKTKIKKDKGADFCFFGFFIFKNQSLEDRPQRRPVSYSYRNGPGNRRFRRFPGRPVSYNYRFFDDPSPITTEILATCQL
jgi:hypothetical protein